MSEAPPKRRRTPETTRPLPHSVEAEQGVISSCMLDPAAIGACVEKGVTEWWFHLPAHQTIYGAVVELWNDGAPTDFIALTDELRKLKALDNVGGAAYITFLFTLLPTAANVGHYLDILEEKHLARQVIKISTEFASRGYDEGEQIPLLVDEFESKAMNVRSKIRARKADVKSVVFDVINDLQTLYENPGVIGGLSTGLKDLDEATDGLHPEEMVVIAARPSNGKTALAMRIVEHVVFEEKEAVAVFSLEMSAKQLIQRLMLSMARVNYFAYRDGFATDEDFTRITLAAGKIVGAKDLLFIDDAPGQSIQEIRAKARRYKAEHGISAVVLDYLQLAKSNTKRAQEHRAQEVSEISGGCKEGARETGIPWVVLAQINRDVDRTKRRPVLADLRESGSIEQDADTVAFLQRDDLMTDDEEEKAAAEGKATLIIAKARHGPIGDVPLTYHKQWTRFESRAHEPEPAQQELLPAPQKRQSRPHRRTPQDD